MTAAAAPLLLCYTLINGQGAREPVPPAIGYAVVDTTSWTYELALGVEPKIRGRMDRFVPVLRALKVQAVIRPCPTPEPSAEMPPR